MDNPKNNQTTMNTTETNENPAASDLSSAAGSKPKKSKKRVSVVIDGKRATRSEEWVNESMYGMGKWWFEEGQHL